MKFKVVADTLSEEELLELENRDITDDILWGLNNGTIVFSHGPWEKSVNTIKNKTASLV